jgi:predicted O-methyltransferase YrrM
MKTLHFKHEDTRRLVVLVLIVVAGTALAGLHSALLAVLVCVILSVSVVVSLQLHLFREAGVARIQQLQEIQSLLYLHTNLPLTAPLSPLTDWSATPQLAGYLHALLRSQQPRQVVELGSGASTVVMAYALEQVGGTGTVVSVDHDAAYGAKTRQELARHHLDHRACFYAAPLGPVSLNGQSWQWYDLRDVPLPEQIDLLVVDGPPYQTQPLARYPAIPLLFDRLSPQAVLILDDAFRPEEQAILQRWLREYPDFQVEYPPSRKGIAVLRRRAG